MQNIANYLADLFIRRNGFDKSKKAIYCKGIELILADAINFMLILLFGVISGSLKYSCIYILLLVSVRKFCGGFHAKTYWLCRIVTVGTYIIVFALNRLLDTHRLYLTLLFDISAFVSMVAVSPIQNPNKIMTDMEIKVNKLISLIMTLLFSAVSIVLVLRNNEAGFVIALTLLAITVLMYVGLLANNRKEGT